jgi:TDG/mug DNA glycosylase family protein
MHTERRPEAISGHLAELPDVVGRGLCILFVGFNPGIRSSQTGHHFAGYSNRFWKLLHASGLTSRLYSSEEDATLLLEGYGITNIVPRPTRSAAEIRKEEYRAGAERLIRLIEDLRPAIVCYEGIGVYRELTGMKAVECGRQHQSVVAGVIDFVVPSPSGLNRIPWDDQLKWHRQLACLKDSVCAATDTCDKGTMSPLAGDLLPCEHIMK